MMNCLIKLFILFLNVLILSACNDAITRFWNHTGWEPSPKESKAYEECIDELKYLSVPESNKNAEKYEKNEKWYMIYNHKYKECMDRKRKSF